MLIFTAVAAICALPAGKLGQKFGRKKTIMAGLSIFLAAFIGFFCVFIAMLGQQDLSVSKYVTVNNAYISVNDQLNQYNADLTAAAKEAGITLEANETLNMDKYIEYRQAVEANEDVSSYNENYAKFDSEVTSQEAITNGVVGVAHKILSKDASISFGNALAAISATVAGITKILRILIYPVLILGGAANMFITVNTLPLVLDIGGIEKVGTFTGYYYTATFSAQIATPIIYGFIRMFAGTYMSLFYYCPIAFLLSVICLIFVHHGEAVPDDVVKQVKLENED